MTKFVVLFGIAAYACKLVAGRWPWQSRGAAHDPVAQEARILLGLSGIANQETILAAHRRLIQQAHPDRGGSTEKVHQANAARDVLMSELMSQLNQQTTE